MSAQNDDPNDPRTGISLLFLAVVLVTWLGVARHHELTGSQTFLLWDVDAGLAVLLVCVFVHWIRQGPPAPPPLLGTRVIPAAVKSAVWARDRGQCVECGSRTQLEFGHIIPWSKGGANTVNNIQIECFDCNRRKGNRI